MEDEIRSTAFEWLKEKMILHGDTLPRSILEEGLYFRGSRITLIGPSGIWKPKLFENIPISITSTIKGPYNDEFSPDGLLIYRYRGTDPNHPDNVGLREAMRTRSPLIYFYGVVPGRYLPIWPVFILQDKPEQLHCLVAIDPAYALRENDNLKNGIYTSQIDESSISVRRYVMVYARQRLHQTSFRERVIDAYGEKCALCALRHRELLDAAHIIPDSEKGGDPIIQNGLSMCKIHHAAFDKNIIGIAPEYTIKIRHDILDEIDGPMLLHGLQELHENKLILPSKRKDWPDQDRLEIRYRKFPNAS